MQKTTAHRNVPAAVGQEFQYTKEMHSILCKKVADLIKVIDKIFRESQLRQFTIVQMKEELSTFLAVKAEKERLEKDIEDLRFNNRNLRSALEEEHKKEVELLRTSYEQQINDIRVSAVGEEKLLKDKLKEKEYSIDELRRQLENLSANCKELEYSLKLYQDKSEIKGTSVASLQKEIEHLKQVVCRQENIIKDSSRKCESLLERQDALQKELQVCQNEKEQLQSKLSLMQDVSEKEVSRKDCLTVKETNKQTTPEEKAYSRTANLSRRKEQSLQALSQKEDAMAELARLRQEVLWYRMELLNREGNFNRIFCEQTPVAVDSLAGVFAGRKAVSLPKLGAKDSAVTRKKISKFPSKPNIHTGRL